MMNQPQSASIEIFMRQIRSRSAEHLRAMELLASENLAGQMIAILRQELDSMVRVIYLLAQSPERQKLLIDASVRGEKWTREGSRARVTDREMVDLGQALRGWTQSVYKFGCAFIHLSNLHDYNDRDPLLQLPSEERRDVIEHCRFYHGGPSRDDASFDELVQYFPAILRKISGNLAFYLKELEQCKSHAPYEI